MKPLLKWPGDSPGATPMIAQRVAESLSGGGRFISLFAGGATVFFGAEPERCVLVDSRKPLMAFYEAVQRDPVAVHDELMGLVETGFDEEAFNHIKDGWNGRDFGVRFAAKFIYLNNVSAKGSFFADVGQSFTAQWKPRKRSPSFPTLDHFQRASSLLRRSRIYTRDYSLIVRSARRGDVVYADAPCWGVGMPYGGGVFGEKAHTRLARLLGRASDRGVRIFVSNIECDGVRRLYGAWGDVEPMPIKRKVRGLGDPNEVLVSATTSFAERNQLSLFDKVVSI